MCGIAGIFDTVSLGRIDKNILTHMNDSMTHRGPDASGYYLSPGIGLGHRRLSIIDLEGGIQPLKSSKGFVVTFNGEIYNFRELRAELIKLGHQFDTKSDTEVLLKCYIEWGAASLSKLRGMFAFAIWDVNKKSLFLARDRLGIKPLYYSMLISGHFIFGSELKALQQHPEFRFSLCDFAVQDYFALGYIPDPKSIYKGTYKLPPGHYIELNWGDTLVKPMPYWDVDFSNIIPQSEASIIEVLNQKLDDAVRARLVADVPLGAFLSGGVDSSAVVASMSRQTTSRIRTCAIGFNESAFDESRFARIVAKQYDTEHHENIVNVNDLKELHNLINIYDEPFADSSAIPTLRVCEYTRKFVKVALSGDGGDEVFAGYRRYHGFLKEERLRKLIPAPFRMPFFKILASIYPKLDFAPRIFRAKSTFEVLAKDMLSGYFHNVAIFRDEFRRLLFSSEFLRKTSGYHPASTFEFHMKNFKGDDLLSLVQYLDIKTYLAGDILTKVHRASMAHGLEVRVPILDHHLIEWSTQVASNLKLRQSEGKFIFKKSQESRLPHEILYRKKQGFSIPLGSWFKNDLRSELLMLTKSETINNTGLFNSAFIERMVSRHLSGISDYSAMLWSLWIFDKFLKSERVFNFNEAPNNANTACA